MQSVYCSVEQHAFRGDCILLVLETNDCRLLRMWMHCDSLQQYRRVAQDLRRAWLWRVFYDKQEDPTRIIRMEQASWRASYCAVQ
jgi:hypothetical protein